MWHDMRWRLQDERAYRFSSSANVSKGDKVPDVNMIERTPILTNSSIARPGLKHHQLSVLDILPA